MQNYVKNLILSACLFFSSIALFNTNAMHKFADTTVAMPLVPVAKKSPEKLNIEQLEQAIEKFYATKALEGLKNGNLTSFDALVGEASCQIRAIAIVQIYRKLINNGLESLDDFDKEFVTLSYILTKFKEPVMDEQGHIILEKFNYKDIYTGASKNAAEKIILNYQRRLAELSVKYLKELAANSGSESMQKALDYVLLDSDETRFRRPHCACYPSISFIFQTLMQKNFPIVIEISPWETPLKVEEKLLYIPDGDSYVLTEQHALQPNEAVVVISGYSDSIATNKELVLETIKKIGIINILMGTFATHPQFTGKQRSKDIPYEELGLHELQEKKKEHVQMALEYGCSINDRRIFLATHIYPSTYKLEFPNKINDHKQ